MAASMVEGRGLLWMGRVFLGYRKGRDPSASTSPSYSLGSFGQEAAENFLSIQDVKPLESRCTLENVQGTNKNQGRQVV